MYIVCASVCACTIVNVRERESICILVWEHLLSSIKNIFKADLLEKRSLFMFIWECFCFASSLGDSFAGHKILC